MSPESREYMIEGAAHPASPGAYTPKGLSLQDQPSLTVDDKRYLALVVTDDADARNYITVILQRAGLQTIEAADGADGLDLYRSVSGTVDLLICGVTMPRMEGSSFARSIRAECPMIPVIFISSEPLNRAIHDPVRGVYWLPSPFHAKDVLYAAQRLLLSR